MRLGRTDPRNIKVSYPRWLNERSCSLLERITIRPGPYKCYRELSEFHYRSGNDPAVVSDVFGAFFEQKSRLRQAERVVGVIVYASPALHLAARNRATKGRYVPGRHAAAAYRRLNREVKTIARVVVDPQFLGIGLAVRLMAETIGKVYALYVESLAAMGKVNPFFEKAGMTRWPGRVGKDAVAFIGALRSVGIGREVIPNTSRLEKAIAALPDDQRGLVTGQMYKALDSYQRAWSSRKFKRDWLKDLQRVSANMLNRADYFIWKNPNWQVQQKE